MRIALIADTHLSACSPECFANWHAARRARDRLGADLTVNLGDGSGERLLDGQLLRANQEHFGPDRWVQQAGG